MSLGSRLRDTLLGQRRDREPLPFLESPAAPVVERRIEYIGESLRTRPGQEIEGSQWLYAPGGVQLRTMAEYAMSIWVHTAITRLAEMASVAQLKVIARDDPSKMDERHPLLDLLGYYGQPNDAQDSLEFFEQHFTLFDLVGNVYWYWSSRGGGAPSELYILDPTAVQVIPGKARTVDYYEYRVQGKRFKLSPAEVTHFKKASPFSIYYGMSAVDVLMGELAGDRSMSKWNREYFTAGLPSGIIVIPADTSDVERDRISDEMNAELAERRRVVVIRAEVGSSVWNDAALKHHDLDFEQGRLLSRQMVFDALGLHVGLLSEASTEAHARVAERRVLHSVWLRHIRTASRLNQILGFWAGSRGKAVMFEDVRVADWQQESMKIKAHGAYLSDDEMRAKFFNLGPRPEDSVEMNPDRPDEKQGSDNVQPSEDRSGA